MPVLDERHAHPSMAFFRLNPSWHAAFDKVLVVGAVQTALHSRLLVRRAIRMLRVGGTLEIRLYTGIEPFLFGQPLRPRGLVLHDLWLAADGALRLVADQTGQRMSTLRFEKLISLTADHDSIARWTFGIIDDGSNPDGVVETFRQLSTQGIPECQLLVCAPSRLASVLPSGIELVPDDDLAQPFLAPTPAKKNRLVQHARYENVVLMHNRFRFPADWYKQMISYGNYWDLLCLPIRLAGTGRRVLDWVAQEGDSRRYWRDRSLVLPYGKSAPATYIDGGLMIAKRSVLERCPLDERLHWGECEDIQFSRAATLMGFTIELDPKSGVETTSSTKAGTRFAGPKYHVRRWTHHTPAKARLAASALITYPRFVAAVRREASQAMTEAGTNLREEVPRAVESAAKPRAEP